jgi:N-acetylglutamate synthase-like GNAT family acetyltransferase
MSAGTRWVVRLSKHSIRRQVDRPLLLWDGGIAVGVIRIDLQGEVAVFRRVAVRDDLQRRGYGRRLLDLATQFAERQACVRIDSHVDPDAVGFYSRCGFARVEDGTIQHGTTILMTKPHLTFGVKRIPGVSMTPASTLGLVAAWFIFGMTRIVLTSKLAEHRIDHPDPGQALAVNRKAAAARRNAANYDPPGRRLLPWYRAINATYWAIAAGGCGWVVLHA